MKSGGAEFRGPIGTSWRLADWPFLRQHGSVVPLLAFIDESGQRAKSPNSSEHFVMSAVVFRDLNKQHITRLLGDIRSDLGRRPGDRLHWKNIRGHSDRLRGAQLVGGATYLKLASVVTCKNLLAGSLPHEHMNYLFTFRLLLERLSWMAEDERTMLSYTLSHVRRFPKAKLRAYEARLRQDPATAIKWAHLDPKGGRIDNDQRVEELQLADLVASATAAAFEPDRFGNTERRYLEELVPRIYPCRRNGRRKLPAYGLKMHPWNGTAQARHPWVASL